MKRNLTDIEYAAVLVGYLMIAAIALMFIITNADAYVISKTRNATIYNTAAPKTFIRPTIIVLNATQINWLVNAKTNGQSWAYQGGYDQAAYDIGVYLGIRKKEEYRITAKSNYAYEPPKICFPWVNDRYFLLNVSQYTMTDLSFNVTKNLTTNKYSNMLTIAMKDLKINQPMLKVEKR